MESLYSKPLLSDEQFSKLLEDDSDAGIWLALKDAANANDPILNRVFSLARAKNWSRFRTVMVCAYLLAQRQERMVQLLLDKKNYELPQIIACEHCLGKLAPESQESTR